MAKHCPVYGVVLYFDCIDCNYVEAEKKNTKVIDVIDLLQNMVLHIIIIMIERGIY